MLEADEGERALLGRVGEAGAEAALVGRAGDAIGVLDQALDRRTFLRVRWPSEARKSS